MHASAIKEAAESVTRCEADLEALDALRAEDGDRLWLTRERSDRSYIDERAAKLVSRAARDFYAPILDTAKARARDALAHAKQRLRTAIADAQAEGQL